MVVTLDINSIISGRNPPLYGTFSSGGSHKEVRGKLMGIVPTCGTCQGYGTRILLMHIKKTKKHGPRVRPENQIRRRMFVVLSSRRSLSSAVQRRVLLNDFIIGRFK